jgi:hypothetical protein
MELHPAKNNASDVSKKGNKQFLEVIFIGLSSETRTNKLTGSFLYGFPFLWMSRNRSAICYRIRSVRVSWYKLISRGRSKKSIP